MPKEIEQILQQCYEDIPFFGKVLFPRYFDRPFDPMHEAIFDLVQNSDNPRKVIIAPRGSGKTTIDNLLIPSHKILFNEKKYIVPVGATAETAIEQAENLKNELLTNEDIASFFEVEKHSSTFSKSNWIIKVADHEVNVRPKGAGQAIRGMNWRGYRPDLIVVDDLENEESVANEDRRKALKEWFFGALLGTVDKSKDNWDVIVIGTLLHEDSLLMNLVEDPNWDSVVLELCDDDLNTLQPNFMSTEKVKQLHKEYKDAGELDVFAREYRSDPISKEDAVFQQSYFKQYDPKDYDLNNNKDIDNIVIVDIARTTKVHSAHSAIVGVAFDPKTESIFVRDIVHGKLHPNEIYDEAINMCTRINAYRLGVEITGLNEFVTYPLRNELFRRARHVELVELHARGGVSEKGKVERVRSLVSFYRQGLVYHNPSATDALEMQLLSFPKSKRWDIMDALGYVPEMLEKGQRYMYASEDYDAPEEIEAEMRDLEYERQLPRNEDFRMI
jgi:hypothetical protein